MYVYDGYDRLANLVTALTGSGLPSTLVSTGQALFMGLVSDASVEKFGFKLQYKAGRYKM